jgi:transposase-like protein
MADPSRKGVKSEGEVAEEAKKKKAILDQVAQSSLPTKTMLKELGISRSTYYSWLKRYEEEGMEGLMDSRSIPRDEEHQGITKPSEALPLQVADAKSPLESTPVHEPLSAPTDESVAAAEPTAVKSEQVQAKETEEADIPPESDEMKGGAKRKGMGLYGLIAVFLLIVGLLLSISLNNYNTYQLKRSGETLTLWKGKFAPRGSEVVSSFEPVVIGDSDVSALVGRKFNGKDNVYKAMFTFFMDQVTAESAKGDKADAGKISRLLDRADVLVGSGLQADGGMAMPRLELAQKRIAIAEAALRRAYKKALPVYQEALNRGLGDAVLLKAQMQTIQTALGLTTPAPSEPAGREVKTNPEPAAGAPAQQQPRLQAQKPTAAKPAAPAKP